jgi:RHH-type rel operon transcriptional repressor/antitoxin RelB
VGIKRVLARQQFATRHSRCVQYLYCNIEEDTMGSAVSLRLPEDLKIRLETLAKRSGRSKTYYIIEAISEKLEDLEDLYLAEERARALHEGRSRTYTLDEVEKRLGLADLVD